MVRTIVSSFEEQVGKTPKQTAVVFKDSELTYEELNKEANILAHHLVNNCKINRGDIVPLLLDRNEKIIIAMLAVLKAGACYTALSKQYPNTRISFVCEQTEAKIIIDDAFLDQPFEKNEENLGLPIASTDLAYIVYTSGTTGNPKGVLHTHQGIVSHIQSYMNYLSFDKKESLNMLFLVNYVFSVAATQIYSALFFGHTLFISEPDCLENIQQFTNYINEKEIHYFQCTPSLADNLNFQKIQHVKMIAVAGEKIPESLFYNTQKNNVALINVYGQSEFHAGTAKKINDVTDRQKIGSALKNMTAFVLDEKLKEVAIGEVGEICMSGAQLSLGYLKLEQETHSHFIDNPFGNGTLCRTGDLVRRLEHGEYEFIGRNDFQLNINGIRLEPGEIETHLTNIPEIEKAVVAGYDDQLIVAYYVSLQPLDERKLQAHLAKHLPEYMQPQIYIWLAQLPLNINGKLDRRKLPKPKMKTVEYQAPVTEEEKAVVAAVGKLLKTEKVGMLDNFFHLGGNSLKAMQLSNLLFNKTGKKLTAKDIFAEPVIGSLAKVLNTLESREETLLFPAAVQQFYPMSPAQKRMFVFSELNPADTMYNEQTVLDFSERIDEVKMQASLEALIDHHEILRTRFFNQDGRYVQEIQSNGVLDFQVVPYTDSFTEFVEPMNLDRGQTMRVRLLRGLETDHLFIDKHHIITDGTSEQLFYKELEQLYNGKGSVYPIFDYKDYSVWFHQLDRTKEQQWWRNYLSGYQKLELITDKKADKKDQPEGRTLRYSFDQNLVKQIRLTAKKEQSSEYMLFFSAVSFLLSRQFYSSDFILGTVSNGRVHEATESMLGMFVNTLPVRVQLETAQSIKSFFKETQENLLAVLANQNYQFEEIIADLHGVSGSGNPLFDCMFVYQNVETSTQYFGGRAQKNPYKTNAAKFMLTFEIEDTDSGIELFLNYDTVHFETKTMNQLIRRLTYIMEQLVNEPQKYLSQLSLVSEEEKQRLITFSEVPVHQNVVRLFEQQVRLRPDAPALKYEEHSFTYAELNAEVNKLAHYLLNQKKVRPEQKIPLLLQRSEKMIVAILGVLKAGAAYVPVSLKYPKERIRYILDTCEAAFVIDDTFMNQTFSDQRHNPETNIEAQQLAYLIFTSGTSGTPKGVMVTHENLSNYVVETARMEKSGMESGMVNGAFFEYVFDSSVHDLIRPFTLGESVVVLDTDLIYDIDLFIQTLKRFNVNAIGMTPSLAARIDLKKVPSMKVIHCGGEAMSQEVIDMYADSAIQLNNCYGPTETTVLCFVHNDVSDLSIGQPIGGVHAYVLDDDHQLLPEGAVGNLFIGGRQVTVGYINQPEETAKRYLNNPFGEGSIYDTGDLVRLTAKGTYEYFGRKDFQVKIRGYRIELGEIETKLQQIESIGQAAVVVKNDQLTAYYSAEEALSTELLYDELAKTLPAYMLPGSFTYMKELPLTINGKLDVRALPEPEYQEIYTAPETSREKEIEAAVCSVLDLERVSADADFFRLGGNSLAAISLASLINIPVKEIFEKKTIRNLAKVKTTIQRIEKQTFHNSQEQVLSYAQERLFFIDQLEEGTAAYNVPILLTLSEEADLQRLEQAVQQVIARHDILRTIIVDDHQEILNEQVALTHEEIDMDEFFSHSFDLRRELPIRINIYDRKMAIVIHHIAFDGWSTTVFLEELLHLYKGEVPAPVELQYRDFAKWQTTQDKTYLEDQEAYWLEKLAGYEALDFPTDFSRPQHFNYRGREFDYELSEELLQQLKLLAKKNDTSLYCVTLSAFTILLSAYSGQKDIILGTPIANRHIQGTENMIGLFVNSLVIRTQIDPGKSFTVLLRKTTEQMTEAQANQELPFERLVHILEEEKDLSRNPVFQLMFGFQDLTEELEHNELFTSVNEHLNLNSTKFDLSVMHRKSSVNFTFAESLFKKETIQGIAETYEQILQQIVADPAQSVASIVLNPASEQKMEEVYPASAVHELFEQQAALHPESPALVFNNRALSYAELNQAANQFAHTLIEEYGVTPGMYVPILLERSENYVIALLGILKTGAAYVPLSVSYPQERIDYITKKVQAPLVISDDFTVTSNKKTNPAVPLSEEALAYVIFTSGTTGKPKGVMIEHRGIVNTIYNQIELYHITSETRAVHFADFVFDASVFELFYTLLSGAVTYLADEETRKDYQMLKRLIEQNHITLATLPPAILDANDLLSLETLIVAGESTPKEIYQAYAANQTQIVNAYGPTETTICATVKFYEEGMASNNIGKALKNVVTYVLDAELRRVPVTAVGELCVGGVGLAAGYIGDPKKTREAFFYHPQYGRLYKTGDLVKQLPNGELLYIGRNDFQVKVRGFRIELGEIEAKLMEQKSVVQCLAVVKGNNIVVYYKGALEHPLDGSLPAYMLPESYIQLEEFPLTINGKIDLRKLPEPVFKHAVFVEPETEREKEIAGVFCELLNLETVSAVDDFYGLGGNSLLALKLANRINVQVKQVFEEKTIQKLAGLQQQTVKVSRRQFKTEKDQVLSFAQERLWFIEQFEQGTSAYNVPLILQLASGVSKDRLEAALVEIVERHEVLRTVIQESHQKVLPDRLTITHEFVEINAFISKVFDLAHELPIRVNLCENQLAVVVHHIAFDGWSTELFLKELIALYHGETLKPLAVQYKDFSHWQRAYLLELVSQQTSYWEEALAGYETLTLPLDYERPKAFTYHGAAVQVVFDEELKEALEALARKQKTSLYTIMLSALDVLLAKFSYQQDIMVGTPFANRHIKGTEELIGFFVNTLPVRTQLQEDMVFIDLVKQNHQTIMAIQKHQDIPFEQIVKVLNVTQDASRNALFQVLFSVQDFSQSELASNDLFTGVNDGISYDSAKYDLSVLVENGLISFNYCTNLFKETTVQSMLNVYLSILEDILENDKTALDQLAMADVSAQGEQVDYPEVTVVDLFKEQAARTPNQLAVLYQDTQLTYAEFDRKTNQLANFLLENGVKPGDNIPLILERSEKMAIAIWGILKAGCAYVPVSPDFPEERKKYILKQTEAKYVIDETFDWLLKTSSKAPEKTPAISDLAYIIFTSGTTGKPKGVMIEHGGLSNRIQWMNAAYPIRETDRIYQKTNYVFDVSVWEQVWALTAGAQIVFALEGGHKDPVYLAEEIQEKGITVMHFVPSMLNVFLDMIEVHRETEGLKKFNLSTLKYVFCSGEALGSRSVKKFKKLFPTVQLHNLYGPTEASIDVTCFDCNDPSLERVIIGKPVANTSCYVLSQTNQLLPVSAVGELALGGIQLARGYINQPELTAEAFLEHPTVGRIYKTGDLVRLLETGEIDYLGRNDFQVKIHGLRIELSEIEAKLTEISGITQAVVLAVAEQLTAYCIGEHQLSEQDIRRQLEAELPDYMIPAAFVFLDSFPLTVNGKLDRNALPAPIIQTEQFALPETEQEICLQKLIAEVLGLKPEAVSVLANFFHLGGDSIKAIQLSNRVKQTLKQNLTIKQIFEGKTIRNLALLIGKDRETAVLNEQGELTGEVKLLPIQKWFFEEINTSHFNQAFAITLPRKINVTRLKQVLTDLVNYHDALRLSFKGRKQYYTEKVSDVALLTAETAAEFTQVQQSFSLDGQLYRFVLRKRTNQLVVICHHLIIDSVSWQILAEDLKQLYEGQALPEKGTSYRQWSEEIQSISKAFPFQEGAEMTLESALPLTDQHQTESISFNYEMTGKLLNQTNHVYNTQINDILLTAFARALTTIHQQSTTMIKLESHGRAEFREDLSIYRTVGWFTAIYPQKISTDLIETKQYTNQVKHYGVGYGAEQGIHSEKLPGIMFNYLGQLDNGKTGDWMITTGNFGESTDRLDTDILTVNGGILQNELFFEFSGTIENLKLLAVQYQLELENLVNELSSCERTYLTKDDTDSILTQEQLNTLQQTQELEAVVPANTLQEGFVYHALNNRTMDDAYLCSFIFDYEQLIDVAHYRQAWLLAQEKYPSLRLQLNADYEEILQVIPKKGQLDFELLEQVTVEEVVQAQRAQPFNLADGSLLRIRLIKHSECRYSCVLTNHHAILDGWSNPVLLNFVHEAYSQLCKGHQVRIDKDDAYLESQYYLAQTKHDSYGYWKEYLGEVAHPDLAGLFKEEQHMVKLEEVKRIEEPMDKIYKIPEADYKKLTAFAKQQNLTVNIITQYVWHKVLSIYGGIKETTVGVVNAGRNLPIDGIEESVGLYIRTLPIQFAHTDESVQIQLHQLQENNHECMMHNNISLAELQSDGTRLFDTLFIYENYPLPADKDVPDKLRVTHLEGREKLDYPLTVVLYEQENHLSIHMKYAGELFAEETIDQLFALMQKLLDQIVLDEPFVYVDTVPDFGTARYPETTITEVFEQQVLEHPADPALWFDGECSSFSELNSEANRIAHTLMKEYAVNPGDRVPLLLEKSGKMIAAILGILKAGAVYVPMSVTYSSERIKYIKEQVEAKVVIDEIFMSRAFSSNTENPVRTAQPEDLAYIIFTSGTTGQPKGVMVEHRNFIIYLEDILAAIERTGTTDIEFGCTAEYVFDIFGTEVFGQLLRGKPVNLFTGTPEEFPQFMRDHYVTALQSTPGKISYLFQENDAEILSTALTTIMVGGEKMNAAFADRFREINLINIYGPTEGTVWTSMKKVRENYSNIGQPFPNYTHFILDENKRLLPKGAVGELYVGGPQLSAGYYGEQELTKKAFVENPYNLSGLKEYSRIYKTGDIVRVLPNNDFELIGRNDFQVKIRGFRIELGEIESAMLKVPGVEQVLALALGEEENKYLGVYYLSRQEISRTAIENVLSRYLTSYMMPAGYQHVNAFPLTINGKIDRRALPEIVYENDVDYIAPRNSMEKQVLQAVCQVLKVSEETISVLESFFMIGGDSIKAIKLVSLLKAALNKEITISDIFDGKTIEGIARLVQVGHGEQEASSLTVVRQNFSDCREQKLSFAQSKYKKTPATSYSNVKMAFRLKEEIDEAKLTEAVCAVVERQEILRTKLYNEYQVVDEQPLTVTHEKINRVDYFSHCFDLEKEIPIRVNIYNREFTCVIDHVAFDGWSTSLFLEEIEHFYFGLPLSVLPYNYKDFAKCQFDFLAGSEKDQQLEFWKQEYGHFEKLVLPTDSSWNKEQSEGADFYLQLEDDFYQQLIQLTKEHGLTTHNVLLGAYYLMLAQVTGQQRIPIALPTVNRSIPGIENLIGLFINQFLLCMPIDPEQTLSEFIEHLNQKIIKAQRYQDIPLEYLFDELSVDLSGSHAYFGIQGFKGEALKQSKLFTAISEMNEHSAKDAFSDLTIFVWGQTIDFNYPKQLFTTETVAEFARIYHQILKKMIDNMELKIKDLTEEKNIC